MGYGIGQRGHDHAKIELLAHRMEVHRIPKHKAQRQETVGFINKKKEIYQLMN